MMGKKKFFMLLTGAILSVIILVGCSDNKDKESSEAVLFGDVITSHTVEEAPCVVTSRVERGQRLIFRAKLEDLESHEILEGAKVKLVLGTGEELDMELGPHGAEGTLLYSVPLEIADDAPTGVLEYKFVAEVDGEDYSYEPFDVEPSKLTVVETAGE